MRKINKKNIAGFMVIEAAFSIFIVGVALVAFLMVLSMMYKTEFGKRDYVVATNLAQEGIEIVRNIRDSSWKTGGTNGFSGFPSGDYCVDYLGTTHSCADKLKIRDGFYEYASGVETKFSRKIVIGGSGETRTVKSSVIWKPSGATSEATIEMEDTLYAWADPE